MDGRLSFYDRETIAFSRFLPQFLLPGPLCYSEMLDCIITCSSAFEVECYKYQTLAAAQAAAEKAKGYYRKNSSHSQHCNKVMQLVNRKMCMTGAEVTGKGKQLHTEWKWVFGEMAWDIQMASFTGQHIMCATSAAQRVLQLNGNKMMSCGLFVSHSTCAC